MRRPHPTTLFLVLCSLIPIVIIFLLIMQNGVNIPVWDEWDTALEIAARTREGTLRWEDIFAQRNEHRAPLQLSLHVLTTLLGNWNLQGQLVLSWIATLVSFAVLTGLSRQDTTRRWGWAALAFAVLLFAPRQRINWQMASQLSWHLGLMFSLLALWIIQRWRGWRGVILAVFCAALATLSTTQGMAIWGALPVALWLRGERKWSLYAFWLIAAAVAFVLYFSGYSTADVGVDVDAYSVGLTLDPFLLLQYILTYLGGPFIPYIGETIYAVLAFLLGIVGVVFAVLNIVYFRHAPARLAIWLALMLFAVAIGLMTGLGRAQTLDNAAWQPMIDRYGLYSTVFWIGLLGLALQRIKRPLWLAYANVVLAALLAFGYIVANYDAAVKPPYVTRAMQDCVVRYPQARDINCLRIVFVSDIPLEQVLRGIERLAVLRLSAFADPQVPEYAFILPLSTQPMRMIGEQLRTEYVGYMLPNDQAGMVLFQHPDSRVEIPVTIPQGAARVEFRSAIWVDTANLGATDIPTPQDGATFNLLVQDASGNEQALFETTMDPHVQPVMRSVVVDLSAYSGQSVTLVLVTQARANRYYDWAMWLDPVVIGYR